MSTNRSMIPRPSRWLALLLAASWLPVTAFAETRDPEAVELAERVLEAMGGEEAWAATRFIRFDFFGFRLHHWDRHTGRHRLEGKSREGDAYVVLHDIVEKLKLTFDGVGLTPGDTYWAFINRETLLMERWAYDLQDWEEGRDPTHWQWLDWDRYGRIMLSPRRVKVDDGSERPFGELAVFDHLPDSVFESAAPVALE